MESLKNLIDTFAHIIIQYHNELREDAAITPSSVFKAKDTGEKLLELIENCKNSHVGINRLDHMHYLHHLWTYFNNFLSLSDDATEQQWDYFESQLTKQIQNLNTLLTHASNITVGEKSYQLASFLSYTASMTSFLGGSDSHMGSIVRIQLIDKITKNNRIDIVSEVVSLLCHSHRINLAFQNQQQQAADKLSETAKLITSYKEQVEVTEKNNQRLSAVASRLESQLTHSLEENSALENENTALKKELFELKQQLEDMTLTMPSESSTPCSYYEGEAQTNPLNDNQGYEYDESWLSYLTTFLPFFSMQHIFPPTDMTQIHEENTHQVAP